MFTQKRVGLSVRAGISLALLVSLLAAKADGTSLPPGQAEALVQDLQLSISSNGFDKQGQPELQLEFQNVSERDISVKLGIMLGNGRSQHPTNLMLNLTDSEGMKRELQFKAPFIAGRVDDYVVPLRAGSTYSLKLKLNQFWSSKSNEFGVKLASGKNLITVHFDGTDISETDSLKLVHMGIWKGTIESNALTIESESMP